MNAKNKPLIRHDPATGFAMVVGGPVPYVSSIFISDDEADADARVFDQCSESYHRSVPAVVLTRADYRRLLKAAGTK